MLFMRFEQVIQHCLDLIRLRAKRMDKQSLICGFAISMNRSLYSEQFIGFHHRDQAKTGSWQWIGGEGGNATLFHDGWNFQYPFCRPFFNSPIVPDIYNVCFTQVVVM